MKEDIKNIINQELENINPSLDDIYNGEEIKNKINILTENENKKQILEILDNLKEMGVELNYSEKMSVQELQSILDKIKA